MGTAGAMARPTLWLAPLLLVILMGGLAVPWGSVATVDERTYLEMTLGVQETGLPLVDNGPVERFPQLQARWNLYRDGELWGVMSPGLPYLASTVMRVGGIRAVLQFNLLVLILLAMAIYLAGRELTDSADTGVAAAYVALLSIPLWTSSFGFLPYSLAITGYAWALFFAARALNRDRLVWALAAGVAAGFATSCQLLVFPMLIGLVAALAIIRPTLAAAAGLGTLPIFGALSWLNHTRFGSWNPLSDGPCAWQGCPESGTDPQSVGQMITAALPLLIWLAAAVILLWTLRSRSRWVRTGAFLAILIPLVSLPSLREALARYAVMTWRLLIDVGVWTDSENTATTPDGLGTFIGPHVIKALLQSSPALVLAVAARASLSRLALLWLPVAALFSMLVLRASMPVDLALGHPFLNLRYLMPAAAPLAILTTIGASRLRWKLSYVAVAALVGAVLRWTFWHGTDDLDLWRRILLLRGSLLIALLTAITAAMALSTHNRAWRRAATVAAALALGWGAGTSLGVDLPASIRLRNRVDVVASTMAVRLPHRLALVGYPDRLDTTLTLKADRDIQYLDLKEVEDWIETAGPIDWWLGEDRPVYVLLGAGMAQEGPAPDLLLEILDPEIGLAQVLWADPDADSR